MLKDHINPNVNSVVPYQPGKPIADVARELGLDPDTIAKLASNENPLGPSPKAKKAMRATINEMHIYPDGGAYHLKNKLAEVYGLPSDNFIIGNGSNEILEFIGHCFMTPENSVVASAHAFIVYKLMAKMFGSEFVEVASLNLGHDLKKMAKAIKADTRVVFVCNPNNPTGTFVTGQQIDAFINNVPDDVLVVFDEAYAEICTRKMPDTLKYVREERNVIVLRTFSKAYGLAGLRIGYGIAKPEIIEILGKPRQPFNANAMAQAAAIAALDDKAFVNKSKRLFKRGIADVIAFCEEANLEYIKPVANFMLIKVGDGSKCFEELQKRGVITRPMGGYQLPEWIRISFGTDEENQKLIAQFKEVIKCL